MDQMVQNERDLVIDLESGGTTSEEDGNIRKYLVKDNDEEDVRSSSSMSFCDNGEVFLDKNSGGEDNASLLGDKLMREKRRKSGTKKPPKPPRPPGGRIEISELAMLKRARRERMKAQKKLKAEKASQSSSSSSLCAMLVTVIFCLIIIFQGIFSSGRSHSSFDGSPESSAVNKDALISVQYYKNPSASSKPPTSESPNSVERVSGLGPQEERSRAGG
ncbi:hypothetical protein ACHQM5_016008 [Ranunculus cassubicifolius]